MYKVLLVILLVSLGLFDAARGFNVPSGSFQDLTTERQEGNVNLDFCPLCINEAVAYINVILNVVLDEGIIDDCDKLCTAVANKTSKLFGDFCLVACDGVGIDEFVHLIIVADLDPIWYCELAHLCEINDNGDANYTNFGVYPNTGPQGTTFVIDCSFKSLNGTGTSMLRLTIVDSHNETNQNDFLIEAQKPGTYPEKIGFKTLYALDCDSTKELCDDFPVGTYNVTAQFCNGECDSKHPHSQTYAVGKSAFTVTKKQ